MTARSDRLWPWWTDHALAQVATALGRGEAYTIDSHPAIECLEVDFAERHGTGYGLFCASGTAALAAAYFAMGLSPGAEVLAPTNTFRATVTPLLLLGYRPVLCDVDGYGNLDLADAGHRLRPETEGVVVTHLNGHPVDLDAARRFADGHGLALIEDASHAHGAHWCGRPVGSAGDVAVFSCGTTKMVTGGMGGMLVTSDRQTYERALLFTQPKHRARREITDPALRRFAESGLGANLRGTPVAAILALDHLDRLDDTIVTKDHNLRRLATAVGAAHSLEPPARATGFSYGTWYKYLCRVHGTRGDRDNVVEVLRSAGVPVRAPVPPLHHATVWDDPSVLPTQTRVHRLLARDSFPAADRLARELVELSTRELYTPDPPALDAWATAFQRAAEQLDR